MADALLLLVDDDPAVLAALKRLTMRAGYVVRTASGPDHALSCLEDVGVVVADLLMPGMNGVQFLRQVRKEKPLTTRYLLTEALGFNGVATAVADGSVSGVLYKPWDERMLLRALERGFETHAQRFAVGGAPLTVLRPNLALATRDEYGI